MTKCVENCVHRSDLVETGCIQHIYNRPVSVVDLSHIYKLSAVEIRRAMTRAEQKIITWGKVVDKSFSGRVCKFSEYVEFIGAHDASLARQICHNLESYMAPPMKYIPSDMWRSVVALHREDMMNVGLSTDVNNKTWTTLESYGLL